MAIISDIIYTLKYWLPFHSIENVIDSREERQYERVLARSAPVNDLIDPKMRVMRSEGDTTESPLTEGYRSRKILAESVLNVALFSANAKQLRYIVDNGAVNDAHLFITTSLIVSSLVLQVGVGILLMWSARYPISGKEEDCKKCRRYGDYISAGILLITAVNILITAFGDVPQFVARSTTNSTTEAPEFWDKLRSHGRN